LGSKVFKETSSGLEILSHFGFAASLAGLEMGKDKRFIGMKGRLQPQSSPQLN